MFGASLTLSATAFAGPWRSLELQQWAAIPKATKLPRALDNERLCWRPVPIELRGLSRTPLQSIAALSMSRAVAVRTFACLKRARRVGLSVQTSARAVIAVDGTILGTLRAAPQAASTPQRFSVSLSAGYHTFSAALRDPKMRLYFRWRLDTETSPASSKQTTSSCLPAFPPQRAPKDVRWETERRLLGVLKRIAQPRKRAKALAELLSAVTGGGVRGQSWKAAQRALVEAREEGPELARWAAGRGVEIGDRIQRLRDALKRWPEDVGLRVATARALKERGHLRQAVTVLRQAQGSKNSAVCALQATLWHELDMRSAAFSTIERCLVDHPRDFKVWATMSQLALAYDALKSLLRARKSALMLGGDVGDRWLDLIAARVELGHHLSETDLSNRPTGTDLWDLIRARNTIGLSLINSGSYRRASAILELIPPWARQGFSEELRARALMGQAQNSKTAQPKLRRRAVAALRQAIRLSPGRQDLQARLRLWMPSAHFYTRYSADLIEDAERLARGAKPTEPFSQPLQRYVIRQLGGGRYARYVAEIYRVGRKGATEHSVEISHTPSQSSLEVLEAAVVRCDPRCVVRRDIDRQQVGLYEPDVALYYDEEQTTLTFNQLQPGDVVVVAHLTRDFSADPFARVFGELFQAADEWPVERLEVILELLSPNKPSSAFRQVATPQQAERVTRDVLKPLGQVREGDQTWRAWSWRRDDAPATPVETRMPQGADAIDTLHVSQYRSWNAVARAYAPLIAQAMPSGADRARIRRLAEQIVTGVDDDPRARVEAVYRWVSDRVRYVGLEFGEHSLRPYPVMKVLERGFGDCKDKSTLLVALLRELGVPAQVALVRVAEDGALTDGVASMGVFGHAIVQVPSLKMWLDATIQHHMGHELPAGDAGGQALPIPTAATSSNLVNLPTGDAASHRLDERWNVILNGEGGAQVLIERRGRGLAAARLRALLHAQSTRHSNVQKQLEGALPGVVVEQVNVAGVDPPLPEVKVMIRARIKRLGRNQNNVWRWRPLRPLKRVELSDTRHHDHVVGYPSERHVSIRITASPGAQWRFQASGRARRATTPAGSWHVSGRAEPSGGVVINQRWSRTQRRISRRQYRRWRDSQRTYAQACGLTVTATKEVRP